MYNRIKLVSSNLLFSFKLYWDIIDIWHCMKMKVKSLSRVWLFVTPWIVAYQTPLSMGFSRQTTGVGCHFLFQKIFPTQGLNLGLPHCRQTLYHLGDNWQVNTKNGVFWKFSDSLNYEIALLSEKSKWTCYFNCVIRKLRVICFCFLHQMPNLSSSRKGIVFAD